MAKRKNTAALFEVFHDTRGPASTAASPVMAAVRNLSTWFRSRTERDNSSSEPFDPNDPTTTTTLKSPLILTREPAAETVAAPAPAKPQVSAAAAPPLAAKVEAVHQKAVVVAKPPAAEKSPATVTARAVVDPPASQPAPNGLRHSHFHLDRDRREVTLRLRFTTAVVVCFGIVLTVALSYVLGRRAGTHPTVLAAETQADPHQVEVKPNALDIPRRPIRPPGGGSSIKPPAHPPIDGNGHDHEAAQPNTPRRVDPTPPPAAEEPIIGLNYFIIAGYPAEATAIEARDFLRKNGVESTVGKMPPGYNQNWFAVISAKGFEREEIHNAEYENLKKQIEKLGDKFATNAKSKKFCSPPPLFKKLK